MSKSITETPEQALHRIQSMGFGRNDALVIMAFSARGIDPESIDPRHNVLTYNAWRGAGRQVAKGAISVQATVWIPCKDTAKQAKAGDEPKSKLRPKTVRLFHISQTTPNDSPKGTAPDAADNPALVREGTYDVKQAPHDSPNVLVDVHGMNEDDNTKAFGETPGPYREGSYEVNVEAFKNENNLPQVCSCPMVGVVTNVDCPAHGRKAVTS